MVTQCFVFFSPPLPFVFSVIQPPLPLPIDKVRIQTLCWCSLRTLTRALTAMHVVELSADGGTHRLLAGHAAATLQKANIDPGGMFYASILAQKMHFWSMSENLPNSWLLHFLVQALHFLLVLQLLWHCLGPFYRSTLLNRGCKQRPHVPAWCNCKNSPLKRFYFIFFFFFYLGLEVLW